MRVPITRNLEDTTVYEKVIARHIRKQDTKSQNNWTTLFACLLILQQELVSAFQVSKRIGLSITYTIEKRQICQTVDILQIIRLNRANGGKFGNLSRVFVPRETVWAEELISYHQFYVLYCLASFPYGIKKECQRKMFFRSFGYKFHKLEFKFFEIIFWTLSHFFMTAGKTRWLFLRNCRTQFMSCRCLEFSNNFSFDTLKCSEFWFVCSFITCQNKACRSSRFWSEFHHSRHQRLTSCVLSADLERKR